jgi:DNA-binding MarR family transcriptional regulator
MNHAMQHQGYGFIFSRAARYISRIYNRHLDGASLTISQYGILSSIADAGPIALRELAEHVVIERSALLRMVQTLITCRFLASMPDPEHKRRLLYQLTDEGRLRLQTAAARVCEAEAEIEQRFERSTVESIRDGLRAIADASRSEAGV